MSEVCDAMADSTGRTEELSKSSLDLSIPPGGNGAILRCVDTSVLRGSGGREIKLGTGELTLGRGSENAVVVDGVGMSRVHARVFFADEHWHVEDLGSTNGTRVNNSNVGAATLIDGDTVAFGRVCYKFVKLEPTNAPRRLDLGMDHTLVLAPHEKPGGTPPEEVAPAASNATTRRVSPAPARRAGGTGLGIWTVVVLGALILVVAALVLLT